MKAFNPDKELQKLQHGNIKKIKLFVILLLVLGIIGYSFALYQVRYSKRIIYTKVAPFNNRDVNLAVYIDNEKQDVFPDKNSYYFDKVVCDNNSNWKFDYDKWELLLRTNRKDNCGIYFTKNYRDSSRANAPELYQGLIPVTIDNDGTIKYANVEKDWYNYDEHRWANAVILNNNRIKDKSPNKLNATYYGAVVDNDTVRLMGGENFIDCGYPGYKFGQAFSMVVKFKINKLNEESLTAITSNSEGGGFDVDIYQDGRLHYALHDGTRYIYGLSNNPKIEVGKWYEVAITFDGTNIKLYLDGVNLEEMTSTLESPSDMQPSSLPISLGASRDGQTGIGLVGDVNFSKAILYHRVLTDDEVSKISKNQTIENNEDNLLLDLDFSEATTPTYKAGDTINMEDISQMYVWIPRYKYQLFNTLSTGIEPKMIDIEFEQGNQSSGDIDCKVDDNGIETCQDIENSKWYTHPAFTFGQTELNGIWVGKFEPSHTTTVPGAYNRLESTDETFAISDGFRIIPNVVALRTNPIKSVFFSTRSIAKDNNAFKLNKNEVNTHPMKNTEWGAVAYLTQSKYERYKTDGNCVDAGCEVWINNNTSYITGCAGNSVSESTSDACNTWESSNGKHASTTDNQYGIYDMSGGAGEILMGFMLNPEGKIYEENLLSISTKYYDIYPYNGASYSFSNYGHYGDATRETYLNNGAWYNSISVYPTEANSGIVRGGYYDGRAQAGLYYINLYNVSGGNGATSFRVVLTAQDGTE